MNKFVINFLSAMTITISMADYKITIGQGIPKESIQFVSRTPIEPEIPIEPEPPKVAECMPFNYNSKNYSYWQDNATTPTKDPYYGSVVYWDGIHVFTSKKYGTIQPKVTNFEVDGYRYYTDGKLGHTLNFSNTSYKAYLYGICRIPL